MSAFSRYSAKNIFGEKELYLAFLFTVSVYFKFFAADFEIARLLDWPVLGSMKANFMRYTVRALAVSLPSFAAVFCSLILALFMPRKVRFASFIALDFMLSVLVVSDRLFLRYYNDIFVFADIALLPQAGAISKSILSLLKPADFINFADIPLFIFLHKKGYIKVSFSGMTLKRVSALVLITAFFAAIQISSFVILKKYRPAIINAMYDRPSVCAWTGTASFHWYDSLKLIKNLSVKKDVSPEKIEEIRAWFDENTKKSEKQIAKASGCNLIMIQCEALQGFVVDMRINGQEVTPNLNRFKKECLYFENAFDQTAGGSSADAEFIANTGMFPADFGAAYTRFSENDYNSLAWELRKKGYQAVVVQGTYSAFWNCHVMHPKLGFENQYNRSSFHYPEILGLGMSDKAIFEGASSVFSKLKEPFYGFIVTLSSHHPFNYSGLDDGSLELPQYLKGTMTGDYLTAIHYFDKQFGLFTDSLKKNGLTKNTLIVVYGDHTALSAACKDDLQKVLSMDLQSYTSWKKIRKVPLLFHIPQDKAIKGTMSANTGHMDILPTTAGLLGVHVPCSFGKDLLSDKRDSPVIFRGGSYIYRGALIEPSAGRAFCLKTGEKLNTANMKSVTTEVNRKLSYNDLILNNNLAKKLYPNK